MDTLAWFSNGLATSPTIPIPAAGPRFCRVSAYLIDSSGVPLVNYGVKASMVPFPGMLDSIGVVSTDTEYFTDRRGYIEFYLIKESEYYLKFKRIPGLRTGLVPNQSSVNLLDLAYPKLVSIAIETDPAVPTIAVGETLTLTAMGTFTDGNVLDITEHVRFESSNTAVGVISANTLTGVSVGSTTVTIVVDSYTDNEELAIFIRPEITITYPAGIVVNVV